LTLPLEIFLSRFSQGGQEIRRFERDGLLTGEIGIFSLQGHHIFDDAIIFHTGISNNHNHFIIAAHLTNTAFDTSARIQLVGFAVLQGDSQLRAFQSAVSASGASISVNKYHC
jgi:hypothetical protein